MAGKKKSLQEHPFFKLGKTAPQRDERNIKFGAILKKIPAVPAQWDFDTDIAKTPIPTPMFLNDQIGDCVIAGRAHMTIRFEYFEQKGSVLNITDTQVLSEYKREGGSVMPGHQGLNMLDSLNWWRKKGWKAAGKTYKIHAFAEMQKNRINDVKVAIRYLNGAYIGLSLPDSWQDQIDRGQSWSVVSGANGVPNPNNGHCVFLCGYTEKGPVCITWGRKQRMSWDYLTKYADELYAVVDDKDRFVKKSPIDTKALEAILEAI